MCYNQCFFIFNIILKRIIDRIINIEHKQNIDVSTFSCQQNVLRNYFHHFILNYFIIFIIFIIFIMLKI